MSSSLVERKNGVIRCCPRQPKIQNTKKKNENHVFKRCELLCPDIPEWLQELRENIVDDRVPEHIDSHESSSHEPSLEPTPARSADLGKQCVYSLS